VSARRRQRALWQGEQRAAAAGEPGGENGGVLGLGNLLYSGGVGW
jgi:hypothetical protein